NEEDRPNRIATGRRDRLGPRRREALPSVLRSCLFTRGSRAADVCDDRWPGDSQLFPERFAGSEAARVELRLSLSAARGRDRSERAAEAARDPEAAEASRQAAREEGRPARAGLQGRHRRPPGGAL